MRVGLITIGQSPRTDVTSTLRKMLGKEVEFIEKGALDGLTKEEIMELAPTAKDYVLVTRLKDGTPVKVARRHITPRIQKCIKELEALDVSLNLLLCTGEFPNLKAEKPLIMPEALITNVMRWVKGGRIGVVVPEKEQILPIKRKWRGKGVSVIVAYANPYGEDEALEKAARFLAEKDVDLIVLDCIGFTPKAKELVKRLTGKPVLLPQTLIGSVLRELFSLP